MAHARQSEESIGAMANEIAAKARFRRSRTVPVEGGIANIFGILPNAMMLIVMGEQ
jgi:hypothetical protein